MEPSEKPPTPEPFWTKDLIFLVLINVVLLGIIALGLFLVLGSYQPVLNAWLVKVFRV